MNQRSLIAIIILAGIGSIGSVLAYSGTISAGQGNFNNVLVTGICTGCSGEGSFTTYTTLLNQTIIGSSSATLRSLSVANDGSILAYDNNCRDSIVFLNGTQKVFGATDACTPDIHRLNGQSETGIYKFYAESLAGGTIRIYKNNVLLQTVTINTSQFDVTNFSDQAISISPDGHYIVVYGPDVGVTLQREVILRGS